MRRITPIVLCGGSGTRLWPRSRKDRAKPFLPLIDKSTLFEATLQRCSHPGHFAPPVIVTGVGHLAYVENQGGSSDGASVIIEPEAKNTAAAIALAAARLEPESIMLVCPSDHYIGNSAAFEEAALAAGRLAEEGWLVALGIEPTSPETGYGYIRRGEKLDEGYRIAQFVEKPDLERATQFIASGEYCWNGGIFAFSAGRFLDELARHRPALAEAVLQSVRRGRQERMRFHPDAESFAAIEGESIDYAVMEHTDRAAMVPAAMNWSDIGNWQALRDARVRDEAGNCSMGEVELVDCRNVLVDSDGPRVSVIGLSDVAVVIDGNEVLVTAMTGAQKVGKLGGASRQ